MNSNHRGFHVHTKNGELKVWEDIESFDGEESGPVVRIDMLLDNGETKPLVVIGADAAEDEFNSFLYGPNKARASAVFSHKANKVSETDKIVVPWTAGNIPYAKGQYLTSTRRGEVVMDYFDGENWRLNSVKSVVAYARPVFEPYQEDIDSVYFLDLPWRVNYLITSFHHENTGSWDMTMQDLASYSASQLLAIDGFGQKSLKAVTEKLQLFGLSLRDN